MWNRSGLAIYALHDPHTCAFSPARFPQTNTSFGMCLHTATNIVVRIFAGSAPQGTNSEKTSTAVVVKCEKRQTKVSAIKRVRTLNVESPLGGRGAPGSHLP